MPVNILLCEGSSNSPDVRVLGKLLAGLCEVKPAEGRYGMGTRIVARREAIGLNVVYGLLDGDFLKSWSGIKDHPNTWESKKGDIHFGWRWERKEIENYLIDPDVVKRSLGKQSPDMSLFREALEAAREDIAVYQAARTALSANRLRFKDLSSKFGRKRGKEGHLFPDRFNEESCCEGIRRNISEHRSMQIIEEEAVLQSFETYKPKCLSGGDRYEQFLYAFAGKDLFWAMNEWLRRNGFMGASVFKEKILSGIQNTTDDIADWLPEWQALREIIKTA